MAFQLRRASAVFLACAVLAFGGVCGWAAGGTPDGDEPLDPAARAERYAALFETVWLSVYQRYVGAGVERVDWFAVRGVYKPRVTGARDDEEAYRYLEEMVALLEDPLTFVRSPAEAAALRSPEEDASRYSGVGILLSQFPDGSAVVAGVFDRSPAARGGVRKGERIVAVDGEPAAGKSLDEVAGKIQGPVGSQVALTLADPWGAERTVTLRRAEIQVRAEVVSERLPGGIGYLSIPHFNAGTAAQVLSHLRRLYRMNGLIIDLRGLDPGASLTDFARIAGLFTEEDLGGIFLSGGVFPLRPDREWQGGTGAFGVPPPTRLDYWEKPIAIIVDGSVARSQYAMALVTGLAGSGKAVVVGRGVEPSPLVATGQWVEELPGGGLLAIAASKLVSLTDGRVIDGLAVDVEVPLDARYVEAWYRGSDLDVEAAREALAARLGRGRAE